MSVKDLGSNVTLTFTIKDPATGNLATPVAAVLTVTGPAGENLTPSFSVVSVGVIRFSFPGAVSAGVWRYRLVTTTPNDARDGAYIVAALLGDLAWLPNVTEVADWLPERTVPDDFNPAAPDEQLNTFNNDTQPTGAQVDQLIYAAASHVAARVGTLDSSLYGLAGKAAAVRAAAYVEVSVPRREGGIDRYPDLIAIADSMLDDLATANGSLTGTSPGSTALLPSYSFPTAVSYGDELLI